MATLRSHGTELARVEKHDKLQGSGTAYRHTLALMSDGKILAKIDFQGEYPHSTGWKRAKRQLKGKATLELAAKWAEAYVQSGWTQVAVRNLSHPTL